MELKILFITILFLGASLAFSLREKLEGKQAESCNTFGFVSGFWLFLIFVSFDLEFSYH